ncbi:potassium transporter Kup [Blastochloris tepida]|jgi:KUP system potassium uptake protein|uniref:Probable potassium transport system protein Kup n=1 Tax=Blastochloris tepida TaxID=2233851 RepID=A0A348G5F5_9HYPH|nr:potassium transporter Kup [Blastochloris tepida]BBF94788.1 putative potassium transport system protein kup 2 [Blastochloris tepida]
MNNKIEAAPSGRDTPERPKSEPAPDGAPPPENHPASEGLPPPAGSAGLPAVREPASREHRVTAGVATLALGSLGVVYGDIGTSPLYAFREAVVAASGHGAVDRAAVIGILSLILWSLILVVTVKYVVILLRADNNGEGGTLTLVALAQRALGRSNNLVILLGIAGAALFYGDSIITPAISVLSAVEGLELIAPALEPVVVPITLVILIALFAVQSHGTGRVAAFFGPIMAIWFATLAATGLSHITDDPAVFAALNPLEGVAFLVTHGKVALITLGAVCLVVTGAEALYADLGHFGRKPIRIAWLGFVFPALVLNYFGQGALVLAHPEAIENPFYRMAPDWALVPMIVLATLATVIASQAVITGAYSLTRQGVQLGLMPRLSVHYTSESHAGQFYMPRVNWFLLAGVVALVLLFQRSGDLAAAYGIAVTSSMAVDAMLAFIVVWKIWGWHRAAAAALILPFLFIDLSFVAANTLKFVQGGYVPVALGLFLALLMWTWVKGTRILFEKTRKSHVALTGLVASLERRPPPRVPGTAVFLTTDAETAPSALLHNLKHNKVLHEKNLIVTVASADEPRVPDDERAVVECLSPSFMRIRLTFGYMESPNVPRGLALARKLGVSFDIMSTSFFLSRRSLRPAAEPGMPLWQDHLFILLSKTASDATDFFQIPAGRVVEVGTQITV